MRPNEPEAPIQGNWNTSWGRPRLSGGVAMSPDLSRYVADQLALETSVLKERRQGEGGASGKTKAEGGKVMPELGKGTACIHSSAGLAERGNEAHTPGRLGGLWHGICYLCLCLRCCKLTRMLIHCPGQCGRDSCDGARWIFGWPRP